MPRSKKLKIAVSGSLAYDQIMDFPGRFSDHILPKEIHNLNLSFFLSGLRRSYGGTAGNIAYNLTLLKEKPIILGIAGFDFGDYRAWLKKQGADISRVRTVASDRTATAYIITDQADNQIAAFYPGATPKDYASRARALKDIDLAIIAADDKGRMLDYVAAYQSNHIPYIFDPGQALIAFASVELLKSIKGAKVLIGNDYEIKLIADKLKLKLADLVGMVEILIITKGGQGSEIYSGESKITVKPAKPKNTSDPTGAGDAYRAGLIKGLLMGYNLKACAQLASTVSVYTVEKYGTQTHKFSLMELKKRYYQNYRGKLSI